MKKNLLIIILLLIIISLILYFVISNNFDIFSKSSPNNYSPIDLDNSNDTNLHKFYAKIEKIYTSSITVVELQKNDINHRGEFSLGIDENVELKRKNDKINFSDLSLGQTVLITYTGGIKESYPAQLDRLVKIEVLD